MDRIVQLSELDLFISKENVLAEFLQKNKPILINMPVDKVAVFIRLGMKPHDASRNFQMQHINREHSYSSNKPLQVLSYEVLDGIEYVQLQSSDVKLLTIQGRCSIECVDTVLKKTDSGELELKRIGNISHELNLKKLSDIIKSRVIHRSGFDFSLCKDVISFASRKSSCLTNDSSMVLVEERLSISLESIFVFEIDVKEYISDPLSRIKEDSPYFIKPVLRGMSDLDQLAEIAAKYCGYGAETKVKASELAKKITCTLGYTGKKAAAAAFFIQSNPKGMCAEGKTADSIKAAKSMAPHCQFPYLVYALEHYCLKSSRADEGKINRDVTAFLQRLGYADDNVKYGEMFVRENLRGS